MQSQRAKTIDLVTPDMLVQRARDMVPTLKARIPQAEADRNLPADTIAEMKAAGFFRILQPKQYGGYEMDPEVFYDVCMTLAEGCMSTAWVYGVVGVHNWQMALFDPKAAEDVWGDNDGSVLIASTYMPKGQVTPVEGGFKFSGRWGFSSGIAHCDWVLLGGLIFTEGQPPEYRTFLLPKSDFEVVDTWHTMGLKGTGSGDLAVENVRVPKARSVSLVVDKPYVDGALYKFPAFGLLSLGVAATAMGNTKGALQAFTDLASVKKNQGSRKTLGERAPIQLEMARMTAAFRAARAYLHDEIEQTWDVAQAEGEIPVERRAALRMACTHMVRTGADICRTCYDLGGGAALFQASDLQRRFRDAHAMTQHIVTAPATWELTGRLLFGVPTDASMI